MVLLALTPAVQTARQIHDSSTQSLQELDQPAEAISHSELVAISTSLRNRARAGEKIECQYHLESLLRGARLYTPPPPPKVEKTPEYIALMARLREAEAQRAYDRMTAPAPQAAVHTPSYVKDDSADEITYADVNRQVTLIINVLVTVIACSAGIWVTAWHWPTPARLGLSMVGSVAIAVAEVAIYLGYIKRLGDAKNSEKQKVEAREVLETWVIDGSAKASGASSEGTTRFRKGKHR